MAGLAAVVAAAVRAAVQTQSGAVSLDVAETLAVVALLGCMYISNMVWRWRGDGGLSLTLGGTRQRAAAGLVACVID